MQPHRLVAADDDVVEAEVVQLIALHKQPIGVGAADLGAAWVEEAAGERGRGGEGHHERAGEGADADGAAGCRAGQVPGAGVYYAADVIGASDIDEAAGDYVAVADAGVGQVVGEDILAGAEIRGEVAGVGDGDAPGPGATQRRRAAHVVGLLGLQVDLPRPARPEAGVQVKAAARSECPRRVARCRPAGRCRRC